MSLIALLSKAGRRPSGLLLLCAGVALLSFASLSTAQAQSYQSIAPSILLMDADTHTILFEKASDKSSVPASTSKMMTAEFVFNEIAQGRLRLDDEFAVSEYAWRTGGAPSRGSSMFLSLNSHARVEDLIRGLVIDSGNDAAIVLAEGIAGTEGNFAARMTERAHELGFKSLSFQNAWGKDEPGQRVTARDMALLAGHIIKTYPDLYRYFGEKEFTWNKIRQPNRNPLLNMDIGADGLKTGYIDEASGYGLVGSAVRNGQRLIVAMYGLRTAKDRADEARKILQWGFNSFESRTVFPADDVVGGAKLYGGALSEVPLVADGPVKVLLPRGSQDRLQGKIVYKGPLIAPIEAGQQVARLQLMRGQNQVLDIPLFTKEAVGQGTLPSRAFDASLELGQGLFRKYILKTNQN